jgi:hypothetical protein
MLSRHFKDLNYHGHRGRPKPKLLKLPGFLKLSGFLNQPKSNYTNQNIWVPGGVTSLIIRRSTNRGTRSVASASDYIS